MKLRITQQQDAVTYKGHGKLLLTAEYFVLDGAQALAVPTKLGQSLRVKQLNASSNMLYWVALNSKRQVWLNLVFDTATFTCINAQIPEAERLSKMLTEARKLNPEFLADGVDRAIETHLEFPNQWGLGSSSTLIHDIATWANIDGYQLLKNTIGGSGYDVACAAHPTPILYQLQNGKPNTLTVNWQPPFLSNIYFAYLGKKQLSSEAIKYYKEKLQDKSHTINQLNRLTELILQCTDLVVFEELITEHENVIAAQLKLMKVRDTLFFDYWGVAKSLGAWGGDFVMLTNTRSAEELKAYLKVKEIDTVFAWNELIFTV